MSIITRGFFNTTTIQTVTWNYQTGCFSTSQRVNGRFEPTPVCQPFALDYHMARHGYEAWIDEGGTRQRKLAMASVSDSMPAQHDSTWKPLYAVPVWSVELGGQRELVVKGEAVTSAFADLFDEIESNVADLDELVLPIVAVHTTESEFGIAPVFQITDWELRPVKWPTPIVRFVKPG
jgi:hypothetical protein